MSTDDMGGRVPTAQYYHETGRGEVRLIRFVGVFGIVLGAVGVGYVGVAAVFMFRGGSGSLGPVPWFTVSLMTIYGAA